MSPHYYCSPEDKAPATGIQGLMGYGEADKTNTGKLSQLSLVCLFTSHSLTLQVMPGGREGSWSNIWSSHQQVPASLLLSHTSRLRGGREVSSVG